MLFRSTGNAGLEGSNGPIGYSTTNVSSSGQQNGITSMSVNAASATSSTVGAVNASFSHGTTWGGKIDDKVATTSFERDGIIAQTEVFYNAKENLEAMGIKLVQEKLVNLPTGFPRSFATPPSGWKS